ncbi:MAG: hybrid sensor histidine kinase/response regulator [Sphingobacteriia bacterium]|nr:hybrid sensor histidine kinase/response regulator [Sphingobacteriia bacterium]
MLNIFFNFEHYYYQFNNLMESNGIVLIADDNENNLHVLSTMLRNSGYTVRVAKNGLQVLKSVGISLPELILLDIHMPEMDGYETCKRLKSNPDTKEIPVIFISALTETFNKIHAFESGAVDYITKPFQVEEVRVRVKTHLLLRRRTLELENALSEIKRVQSKLIQAEKMASLGVLSAGIAHEINNPINFVYAGINSLIKNFNELKAAIDELVAGFAGCSGECEKDLEKIKQRYHLDKKLKVIPELADDIKTGAVRTTEIVKGLRLFARSDQEPLVMSRIEEPLETALLLLKNKYKNKIQIIRQFNPDVPPIRCFPGQLSQAFINILDNAIDAIENNGKITISTDIDENLVKIEICDDGRGIAKDIQNKIFDPFFTTKAVGEGTGLGLAITHGIVEKHKGTIALKSSPGTGTCFTILLPINQ